MRPDLRLTLGKLPVYNMSNEASQPMEIPMAVAKLVRSNAIKIEKGVPLPQRMDRNTYPFAQMEIGDSFAVPGHKYGSIRQSASMRGAVLGMKFRVSKQGDEVRCWRIA